jgi:sporulation integral membrane protein YtvI
MIHFYKKYWRTAFDIAMIILTVYLIMWTFSYLYSIAAPIFLAFIIYLIIEPFARFLHRKGMKKSIAAAISMLTFILIIVTISVFLGAIFVHQIDSLAGNLEGYSEILQKHIIEKGEYLETQIDALPDDIVDQINQYLAKFADVGTDIASWFFNALKSFLMSFSTFILNFAIAIILAYFLSIEIEFWRKVSREKTPKTFKSAFLFLQENVLKGIISYLKAQMKLITITFVIVFIALLLLRIPNALSVALLAAFFDVLPLLGVPTLFIPWIIYLLIVGNTSLAIWLTVVLGIVLLNRQILEPKITGDSLGVSAFTMLSFMIISLSLFGVAGLILSPILIILIKELYLQGYLKRWIRMPAEEFD